MIKIIAKTCLFAFVLAVVMTVAQMQSPVGNATFNDSTVQVVQAAEDKGGGVPSEFAPARPGGAVEFKGETGEEQIQSGIKQVIDWIRGFIGAIAVFMFVVAGFLYITARGDDSKMGKAKMTAFGAAAGLVLVVLSGPIISAIYQGPEQTKLGEGEAMREIIVNLVKYIQGFIGAIAVGMIVYGGFQIITARGDESKFGSGKKSLFYAVIGLFAVSLADFAVNKVIYPEYGQRAAGQQEVSEGVRALSGIINWALGFVGIVAVAIMIYGGTQMILAKGDESKYQAGKKTMTYAVIGLMLVIISYSVVGFVLNAVAGG